MFGVKIQTFYILTLTIGLLSCNGTTEKTVDNSSIPQTSDNSVGSNPRQFQLTDTNMTFNPGDYYATDKIGYFFSGDGDGENWMDETPYLHEHSKLTLDSIVDFLNNKTMFVFEFISFLKIIPTLIHVYPALLNKRLCTI